ncbi:phenylalanine 4-monooxygenase [Heterostelium album PN500]|uniref:phenylalanine 4-monooxygenase n=1 Tax=Heterostelium pallidum (strain ATCC 26659 / Pp 5 / PN500) TaxID=670386 RepID=D3BKZ8_HETP5|nr:phenylalanine 4-monooxygenase [Heterostelium album PN500]EFA78578.1 phenylalanine 4-monooxygenase [Heterostelium album PN500]|eukprot:XP_020430702.1 phenylalanine 4-monooxygenase [Heterostelium album PN500]
MSAAAAKTTTTPTKSETTSDFKTTVLFSISDKIGCLTEYLEVIKEHRINITRIESRPSKTEKFDYDFFLDLSTEDHSSEPIDCVIDCLNKKGVDATILTETKKPKQTSTPWFPRKLSDLDLFCNKVLEMGSDLSSDHPGATDKVYIERRKEIAQIAATYKHGEKIPTIEYSEDEKKTWGVVYKQLKELSHTNACRQYRYIFPLLEQNCGYSENNVPQLQDISEFLTECTGFRLRPVQGLLSSRDFLNGLAFRVFHATQYLRHHSVPLYTPEPDICHELLGHVPLFADPDFADFSQEIGMASLGASDEDIERLSTCYWFTVEFGICKEGDGIKAYGAGLLSSFGELEYCLSDKPERKPFDPFVTCNQKYPITQYQPVYFVAESFQSAKDKMKQFAETLDKPFSLRYNPYTQTIEILDTKDKLVSLCNQIKGQTTSLASAIAKLQC